MSDENTISSDDQRAAVDQAAEGTTPTGQGGYDDTANEQNPNPDPGDGPGSTAEMDHGEPHPMQDVEAREGTEDDDNLTPVQMRKENQDPGVVGPDAGDKVRPHASGIEPLTGVQPDQVEQMPQGTLPGV